MCCAFSCHVSNRSFWEYPEIEGWLSLCQVSTLVLTGVVSVKHVHFETALNNGGWFCQGVLKVKDMVFINSTRVMHLAMQPLSPTIVNADP